MAPTAPTADRRTDAEHDDAEEGGPEPHGAVRFRHDGAWGTWTPRTTDPDGDSDGTTLTVAKG